MRTRRWLALGAAAATVASGLLLLGAAPASANQTWVQSFQRPSADAPCSAPKELDIAWQAGWTGSATWTPSWEQWPNGGQGGWTCTRSITWAKDTPPPTTAGFATAHCVPADLSSNYGQFNGGYALPITDPVYGEFTCTNVIVGSHWNYNFVYAPAPEDPIALCEQAFGYTPSHTLNWGTDVYACVHP